MADLDSDDSSAGLKFRSGYDLAKRLVVALLLAFLLGYAGYLAIALVFNPPNGTQGATIGGGYAVALPVSGSVVPGAGTWDVGYCVVNCDVGGQALDGGSLTATPAAVTGWAEVRDGIAFRGVRTVT